MPLLQTIHKPKDYLSKQQGRAFGCIFFLPQTSTAAQGQEKGCRLNPSCGCAVKSLFGLLCLLGLFKGLLGLKFQV